MPLDRVQVIKQETAAGGGDPADDVDWFNTPIEPQEDAIEAAGVYIQSPTARDENVLISRDSNGNITFKDVANPAGRTLTQLLGTAALHGDSEDVTITHGDSIIFGSISTLPVSPAVVVPALGRDITSTIIDDDYYFNMEVINLTSNGFDYRIRILEDEGPERWVGPDITVRFDYIWRE